MGAETFTQFGRGATLDAAFRDAVKEAQYQHGHGGYTGTLAEKSECVEIPPPVESQADAVARAYALLEADDDRISDKWGPAGAVRVLSDAHGQQLWLFFGWASS